MNRIQFQSGLSMPEFFQKVGRDSENKVPFIAAAARGDNGHPLRAMRTPVPCSSLKAIAQWVRPCLAPCNTLFSDSFASFAAFRVSEPLDQRFVGSGRQPKDLPDFLWINAVPGILKTSLKMAYHAFDLLKYAGRYTGSFAYRFNRRFDLRWFHQRLLVAASLSGPHPQSSIRLTKVQCQAGSLKRNG